MKICPQIKIDAILLTQKSAARLRHVHLLATALEMTFATPTAAEFATPTSSAVAESPPPPPRKIAAVKDFAVLCA